MKHAILNSAKYLPLLTLLTFMGWIYIDANTGDYNTMLKMAGSVPYGDKMGHFLLYGALTLILNLTLNLRQVKIGSHEFLRGSVIILIVTFIDEFTQILNESRSFEWLDMSSNLLGIVLFSYFSFFIGNLSWFPNLNQLNKNK